MMIGKPGVGAEDHQRVMANQFLHVGGRHVASGLGNTILPEKRKQVQVVFLLQLCLKLPLAVKLQDPFRLLPVLGGDLDTGSFIGSVLLRE